jgi:hypothetical protein
MRAKSVASALLDALAGTAGNFLLFEERSAQSIGKIGSSRLLLRDVPPAADRETPMIGPGPAAFVVAREFFQPPRVIPRAAPSLNSVTRGKR